jgi:ElaB/YqjD/DUF883 family membrane-anchored ribosome-binding protein
MSAQSKKLVDDVRVLIDDTEELVMATASQASEKIVDIRNRTQQAVANLKPQLAKLETVVTQRAKSTVTEADAYIHENPWTAIGVSAGVGLVIGLLIGRR